MNINPWNGAVKSSRTHNAIANRPIQYNLAPPQPKRGQKFWCDDNKIYSNKDNKELCPKVATNDMPEGTHEAMIDIRAKGSVVWCPFAGAGA